MRSLYPMELISLYGTNGKSMDQGEKVLKDIEDSWWVHEL